MSAIATSIPLFVDSEFYAPDFMVRVNGKELSRDTKGDVLQVSVTMQEGGLASFSMSMSNWDDYNMRFKYSDGNELFLESSVEIQMGYAGKLLPMIVGTIKSWTPKFPSSGALTIDIEGVDLMEKLKSQPNDGDELAFTESYSNIAKRIAARHSLDIEVMDAPFNSERVVQAKDQDDAAFLLSLAQSIGFDLYMKIDESSHLPKLYFGKRETVRRAFKLVWGENLSSYTPRLDSSNQVSEVTVRGYDYLTKKPIVETATGRDLGKTNGSTGPEVAAGRQNSPRKKYVTDSGATTSAQAKARAISILKELANSFHTGSGEVIGLPQMRVGDQVQLEKLGRFSGTYAVTKVVHSIGNSGYKTQFDIKSDSVSKEAKP